MTIEELYTLTIDSYTGGGGFLDGSYIVPHPREDDVDARRKLAYYTNSVLGMVSSLTSPVFGDKITRNIDTDFYRAFLDNCDRRGTSLSNWLLNVAKYDALLGNVFIIMDNATTPPETIGEAIASRSFPYLYYKLPNEVQDVRLDDFGGVSSITFKLDTRKIGGIAKNIYRTIENGFVTDWYGRKDDRSLVGDPINSPASRVIMTGSEVMPIPPFGAIAQTAKAIYNLDSQQLDATGTQAFSILQVPSTEPEASMVVGMKNVLYVHPDGNRDAKYISPDAQVLQHINEFSKSVTDAMIASAVNAGVRVNSGAYKSGTAIMVDSSPAYAVLACTSEKFERIEQKIHDMFCFMAGVTDNTTSSYSKDYTPSVEKKREHQALLAEQLKLPYSEDQLAKISDYSMKLLSEITGMPL
jgi:hypothetical protein